MALPAQALNLADVMRELTKSNEQIYCLIGEVTKVDKTANTCAVEPIDESPTLYGVKLQAMAGDGMVVYPVVGSQVIVGFFARHDAFVAMYSDVDKYTFKTQQEDLKSLVVDLLAGIKALTFANGAGATGPPINIATFVQIEQRLNNFFA